MASQSNNRGCILIVLSIATFLIVGALVDQGAKNALVSSWAGFIAALIVFFVGAKISE